MSRTPRSPAPSWKRGFFLFFSGQSLSLVGSALTQFVIMWWITQRTGSPRALAVAGIAGILPMAIVAPFAGVIVDRVPRKLALILPDLASALCVVAVFVLFKAGSIEPWNIYVLLAIRSSMQAFQQPASKATIPLLVPDGFLSRAAGLNQAMEGVMVIGAAPLGALVLALMPLENALMIDVVTAAIGVAAVLSIGIPRIERPRDGGGLGTAAADLRDALRFVVSSRGLLSVFGLNMLVCMVIMPAFSLTPILVTKYLHGGVGDIALMEFLSGIGMIAGGLAASALGDRIRKMRFVLLFQLVSTVTVALCALHPEGSLSLSVLFWFLSGLSYSLGNAPFIAILQRKVPIGMQGRVFALFYASLSLVSPIGLALLGSLAESLGIRATFIVSGLVSGLVVLSGFFSPSLLGVQEEGSEPASLPRT